MTRRPRALVRGRGPASRADVLRFLAAMECRPRAIVRFPRALLLRLFRPDSAPTGAPGGG